jgi:hypothetical protein
MGRQAYLNRLALVSAPLCCHPSFLILICGYLSVDSDRLGILVDLLFLELSSGQAHLRKMD